MVKGWLLVIAVAVVACAAGAVDPPAVELPGTCVDTLDGCRAAGAACTWCVPVGGACTRAYVDLCSAGLGWCSEAGVCRPICSPVNAQRCPTGSRPSFEPDEELNSDVCFCVPD